MSSGVASLFKKSMGYGAAQLSGPILQYLLVPVYTRTLSVPDYGVVLLMVSVAGVFELLCKFGLNIPMVRLYYEHEEGQARRRFLATFLWLQLGFNGLLFLAALCFARQLNQLIGNSDPYLVFFVLSIIAGGLRAMVNLPMGLYRIQENVRSFMALIGSFNIIQKGSTVIAIVVLHQGLVGYFWALAITSGVYFFISVWIMLRVGGFHFVLAIAQSSFTLALPLTANQFLVWVMNLSDRAILNHHFDHTSIAIYGMGYQFGFMLTYLDTAFFTAWAPHFYKRALLHGDGPEQITRFSSWYFLMVASASALIIGCSRELLLIFSTHEYLASRPVILIVAAAYTINELFMFAGPVAVLQRKPHRMTVLSLLTAALNFGLNIWLIPKYGYMAAAWNTMAALAVGTIAGFLVTRAVYPVHIQWLRIAKIVLAASAACTLGWFWSFDPPWLALLTKLIAVPGLTAAVLLLLRFFSQGELHAIALRLGRLLGRGRNPGGPAGPGLLE